MGDYNIYFVFIQIVLIIPFYFFYRFIFYKLRLKYAKVYTYICIILFPIILTCVFVKINAEYIAPWIRSEKFDSQIWKNEKLQRYKMIKDIIDNNLLIGKSRNEVKELLGQTTEDGPCNNCIGYSTNDPDQGFAFLDHEVLEITFNEQDKVKSVRINSW